MNSPLDARQLGQHIADDIQACQSLLALLEREREALQARDAEALAVVVEEKITPLSHLENSAKQRAQWLNASTEAACKEKWQALLATQEQEQLRQDWQTLKDMMRECKQQNEINGKVLGRHKQVFSRLLDLMRGQTTAPNLYTAQGAATGGQYSNKVGEA